MSETASLSSFSFRDGPTSSFKTCPTKELQELVSELHLFVYLSVAKQTTKQGSNLKPPSINPYRHSLSLVLLPSFRFPFQHPPDRYYWNSSRRVPVSSTSLVGNKTSSPWVCHTIYISIPTRSLGARRAKRILQTITTS